VGFTRQSIRQETLETVLNLARFDRTDMPITLAAVAPAATSHGVEAWTFYGANGKAERIFVYTGSDTFRCARWPFGMHQCRVRLASALVHEAWHFENGRNEGDALPKSRHRQRTLTNLNSPWTGYG